MSEGSEITRAEKKRLTAQQVRLLMNLSEGKTITDAAIAAGYSTKYAGQVGSQALESVRRKMPQILDRLGLTQEALVENYLKPALEAKEKRFFSYMGRVEETVEVVNLKSRNDALDMSFRLHGSYAQPEDGARPVAINISTTGDVEINEK